MTFSLNSLSPGDGAAFLQAILSAVAILYAGYSASKQSKLQFENSVKLQKIDAKRRHLILLQAITTLVENTKNWVDYVDLAFPDRGSLIDAAQKSKYYDLDCLTDIRKNLDTIPIFEIPSPNLVKFILTLISTIRQLDIQVEKALLEYRSMSATEFQQVLFTIQTIKNSVQHTYDEVNQELIKIKDANE